MLRTHVKAEDIDPTLPTPSPSPPRFSRRLPTCRDPAELKEQHVAKARAAAERVRLEHLAQALQSSGTGVKAEEGDVGEQSGMQRYSYMVEQEEDGRKVSKRVTVIVPAATPPPAFTLDKVPRCIPLPSLHRLSLAPPQPPVPLFHSHVRKRPLAVSNDQLEQRRPAFTLQHQSPVPSSLSRTAMWAQDQQRRLAGISEDTSEREERRREDDDAEREVKGARLTLSERRGGRRFAPLCLV
uniref:Uncharacterized protein n=1 Tax=Rhodotorula toruloides TaxID=5286 RepID=A0A0K3C5Z5_RHOTO